MRIQATLDTCSLSAQIQFCDANDYDVAPIHIVICREKEGEESPTYQGRHCQVNLRGCREHTGCMAVRVYVSNYEKKIYVMLCREYVCIIEGRELTEPDMTIEKMVKVNGSKHQ